MLKNNKIDCSRHQNFLVQAGKAAQKHWMWRVKQRGYISGREGIT